MHNVGSLFRTADGVGISKIYLVGVTPDPIDRFGRQRNDFAKVALGAEKTVPWEHVDSVEDLIRGLREENFQIIALEQAENTVDYREIVSTEKTALILGEETEGLPNDVLDLCDSVIEIPMHGEKESLNVSVAGGIAMYQLFSR